jgi:hypothetical protein
MREQLDFSQRLSGLLGIGQRTTLGSGLTPITDGLEYLHRSPASRKRRRKGNPVSNETVIYGYGSFAILTSE